MWIIWAMKNTLLSIHMRAWESHHWSENSPRPRRACNRDPGYPYNILSKSKYPKNRWTLQWKGECTCISQELGSKKTSQAFEGSGYFSKNEPWRNLSYLSWLFLFFSRTPHNLDLLQMLGKEWTKHIFHTWWCVSWWWIPWYQMKSNLNKSKEIETSIARISYIHQGLGIHLLSIMNSKHIVKLKRQGWEIKSWEIENILWNSKEDVEKLKKFPLLFLKTQELPLEKPPTWKPLRGENAQCELGNWLVCFWGSMLPWKSARHHSKECWVKFWVIII